MGIEQGFQGTQTIDSSASEFNSTAFIAQYFINGMGTATIVQVKAVNNAGALSPVGLVDIQIMVNEVDGFLNPIPHSIIHNCPYQRMQGGTNAIIIDPQVGDLGIAVFADKDLSKIIAAQVASSGSIPTKTQNPDSGRRFSFADGLYIGGVLNAIPTQYVQFNSAGINITSPTAIQLNAPDIKLNAPTIELNGTASVTVTTPTFTVNGASQFNGAVAVSSTITAVTSVTSANIIGTTNGTFGGKVMTTHTHSGVTTGAGNTGAPN